MPGGIGRATNDPTNYFAVGVQGTRDQDAGTFYFFKHLTGTGIDVAFTEQSEREGGGGREIALRYKTMVKADGQVVCNARPDALGRLLTYALGADTASVIATTPTLRVNHLIQSGVNATLPYLTVDQNWADITERTDNCVVTTLKLDFQAGHPLKVTAGLISGGSPHVATTTLTPAREAALPLNYAGASIWLQISGGSTIATTVEVTKGAVEIKNQFDEAIQTTGLNRQDVVWENTDYNADLTIKYVNAELWKQQNYQGGSQVAFSLATASLGLFAPEPGGEQSVALGMPMLHVSGMKVNRLDPDGKTMYYDLTLASIRTATNSLYANVVSGATGVYTATTT